MPPTGPQPCPGLGGERPLLILSAGCSVLLVALTVSVMQHAPALTQADVQLHSWVLVSRSDASIELASWLTWGGATAITLPTLLVIGTLASPRRRGLRSRLGSGVMLASLAGIVVYLGLVLNSTVAGVRPLEADWAATAGGPSFPSGHTTAATVFAAFALWALLPRATTPLQRAALVGVAVAYASIVGLTRMWLGVHWPADVLGGWLYGTAAAALAVAGVMSVRRHRSHRGAFTRISAT